MKEVKLEYCLVCHFLRTEEEPLVHVALPGEITNKAKIHIGCWLIALSKHIEDSTVVTHKNKED